MLKVLKEKRMKSVFFSIKLAVAMLVMSVFISGVTLLLGPSSLNAQSARDAACQGVELTGGSCDSGGSEGTVNKTLGIVINIFSVVVGVAAVIMIIIGGLRYITSSGDSASVNSAKNTILYAIIGLVIVALAQVIVRFVLNQVS